jgi:UDP-N-acetylmuramoyl-L-alanyl-D-glutamate--2,6-diaminopimelate ligase
VAISGEKQDGHAFIPAALARGASACVAEKTAMLRCPAGFPLIRVENTRWIFSLLCARFHGHPSREVKLIGITGTNGKTTTSYLVRHLFQRFAPCGLIGTIRIEVGSQVLPSQNTTPAADDLHFLLAAMRKLRTEYCAMEVSSHALDQERAAHLFFRTAVFTQLTQDHLDYHRDLEDYFAAKMKLFTKTPRPEIALVNADDPYGVRLIEFLCPRPRTYGVRARADYQAVHLRVGLKEIRFDVKARDKVVPVRAGIPCLHNVYNVLAAFACACEEGWDPEAVAAALESFPGVPGRMERVDLGQDFYAFVDYAHTPGAFSSLFASVKELARGRIITVFGCGGDRDAGKRPMMGEIAARESDRVILTSDNPRSEDPDRILDQIQEGIRGAAHPVLRIRDREEAIHHACTLAGPGDMVLVLGKGHEAYQIVGTEKFAFDDREILEKAIAERLSSGRHYVQSF